MKEGPVSTNERPAGTDETQELARTSEGGKRSGEGEMKLSEGGNKE